MASTIESICRSATGRGRAPAAVMVLAAATFGVACSDHDEFWQRRLGTAPTVTNRIERDPLRAYDGAPPTIPHAIDALGRERCLACHGGGDAVSADQRRRAPITPHPERESCVQCHVPQRDDGVFRKSTFVATRPTERPERGQPMAPPYIPHRLQDREQCQVCHLGPTARTDLVPRHGDRPSCRQCHVRLDTTVEPFVARASESP